MPNDTESADQEVFGAGSATPVRHHATMREFTSGLGTSMWAFFLVFVPFTYEILSATLRPRSVVMSGCVIFEVADRTMLNKMTPSLVVDMKFPVKTFQERDALPLEWCVRCNRRSPLHHTSAVVHAVTDDKAFVIISLLVVLAVEINLLSFTQRMARSILLLEYGVVITNSSWIGEYCNHWSIETILIFAIMFLYGILGRMIQNFSFTEVKIDCSSLLGVVLNPRADDEDTLVFLPGGKTKELLTLLATAVPFLLLTTSSLGFMWTRLTDRYAEVPFKLFVEKPWLLTETQQRMMYGVQEKALEKVSNEVVGPKRFRDGFRDPLVHFMRTAPCHPKIRQVFEKLIEDKALTKLDVTKARISQPPPSEPVTATIGVSEMTRR
jgi:hypothetical protein